MRLAQREPENPADALAVYQRIADEALEEHAERGTDRTAATILETARSAGNAAGMQDHFPTRTSLGRYPRKPGRGDHRAG